MPGILFRKGDAPISRTRMPDAGARRLAPATSTTWVATRTAGRNNGELTTSKYQGGHKSMQFFEMIPNRSATLSKE